MKSSSFIGLVLILASSAGFAQNLRPCTSEKLECTLYDAKDTYHRVELDKSVTPFSGLNSDEPSIQPDACSISTALGNKNGLTYQVNLSDDDYYANLFVRNNSTMMLEKAGQPSFHITAGKKFFYSYGTDLLICELKK